MGQETTTIPQSRVGSVEYGGSEVRDRVVNGGVGEVAVPEDEPRR